MHLSEISECFLVEILIEYSFIFLFINDRQGVFLLEGTLGDKM